MGHPRERRRREKTLGELEITETTAETTGGGGRVREIGETGEGKEVGRGKDGDAMEEILAATLTAVGVERGTGIEVQVETGSTRDEVSILQPFLV